MSCAWLGVAVRQVVPGTFGGCRRPIRYRFKKHRLACPTAFILVDTYLRVCERPKQRYSVESVIGLSRVQSQATARGGCCCVRSRHLRLIPHQTAIRLAAKADWAEACCRPQPSTSSCSVNTNAFAPICRVSTSRSLQHLAGRAQYPNNDRRIRLSAPCRSNSKRRRSRRPQAPLPMR
jgi:hypothetical protein